MDAETAFWSIFRGSRVPMVLLDADATYVDVNEAACIAVGRARDEFIGRRLGFTTAPERRAELERLWTRLLGAGRLVVPWEFEMSDRRTISVDVVGCAHTPRRDLHLTVFWARGPSSRAGGALSPRELEITRLLA